MDTAPAMKKPRRWKRWAAIALTAVTLLATWFYWPREDRRFCGEWQCVDELTGASTGRFKLHPNGRGCSIPAGTSDRWLFRWTFDGDQLVIGRSLSASYRDLFEQVSEWVMRATGQSLLTVELRSDVVEVLPNRIRIREAGAAGDAFTLERVSK
jgi:hypothetical protein